MTVARVRSPRPLSQLALIKSMETVEQAVRVMLERVDTEAEISSTKMTPISRLGSPAELSIRGTM